MQESLGAVLHQIRTEQYKETTRDFAKRCEISRSCLLQLENGLTIAPTITTLRKIEAGLGISFKEYHPSSKNVCLQSTKKKLRMSQVVEIREKKILATIRSLLLVANPHVYDWDAGTLSHLEHNVTTELEETIQKIRKSFDDYEKKEGFSDEQVNEYYNNSNKE